MAQLVKHTYVYGTARYYIDGKRVDDSRYYAAESEAIRNGKLNSLVTKSRKTPRGTHYVHYSCT